MGGSLSLPPSLEFVWLVIGLDGEALVWLVGWMDGEVKKFDWLQERAYTEREHGGAVLHFIRLD